AEGYFVIVPAAPHAVGVQRVPAGAVHAVDGAGPAGKGGGQGGGRHALLVIQIGIVAGDDLPGKIAILGGLERQALGKLGLLPVIDIVGKTIGRNVVIVAADIAVAGIDRIAGSILQIRPHTGFVIL